MIKTLQVFSLIPGIQGVFSSIAAHAQLEGPAGTSSATSAPETLDTFTTARPGLLHFSSVNNLINPYTAGNDRNELSYCTSEQRSEGKYTVLLQRIKTLQYHERKTITDQYYLDERAL